MMMHGAPSYPYKSMSQSTYGNFGAKDLFSNVNYKPDENLLKSKVLASHFNTINQENLSNHGFGRECNN